MKSTLTLFTFLKCSCIIHQCTLFQGKWCRRMLTFSTTCDIETRYTIQSLPHGWSLVLLEIRQIVEVKRVVNCCWLTGLWWVHQNLVVQQKSARQGVWLLWQWTWLRNVYIRHECPVESQPPTFSLHFHSDHRETFSNRHTVNDIQPCTGHISLQNQKFYVE